MKHASPSSAKRYALNPASPLGRMVCRLIGTSTGAGPCSACSCCTAPCPRASLLAKVRGRRQP